MASGTKERPLDPLSVPALYSPWPRRQYVDGGAPLQATPCSEAQQSCSSTAVRAPLPACLPEPRSSQVLRAAKPSPTTLAKPHKHVSCNPQCPHPVCELRILWLPISIRFCQFLPTQSTHTPPSPHTRSPQNHKIEANQSCHHRPDETCKAISRSRWPPPPLSDPP